jgi:hypothetical protein
MKVPHSIAVDSTAITRTSNMTLRLVCKVGESPQWLQLKCKPHSALSASCNTEFFLIPFYLQAVQIHSANGVKLLEA